MSTHIEQMALDMALICCKYLNKPHKNGKCYIRQCSFKHVDAIEKYKGCELYKKLKEIRSYELKGG